MSYASQCSSGLLLSYLFITSQKAHKLIFGFTYNKIIKEKIPKCFQMEKNVEVIKLIQKLFPSAICFE